MKKLEKVVLYHSAIVNPGGLERLLLEEYTFLRNAGIKTKILTFKVNKEALFNYQVPDLELLKGKNDFFSRVISFRRRLIELNPDLIISTCPLELYSATIFTPLRYVLHIHGTLFWFSADLLKYSMIHKRVFNDIRNSVTGHIEFIHPDPQCNLINRIMLEIAAILNYLAVRKAKKIFVLSNQMKWEVGKLYKKKAIVLKGAFPSEILSYKPKINIKKKLDLSNKRIILNVNRLDPRKRVDIVVRAFKNICDRFDDAELVIGGIGPEKKKLKILVNKLGIQERVTFVGYIKDEELWDYYSMCDVFVHPNWADFAISPLEALALGRKVVWSTEVEMDEQQTKNKHIFPAEPTVDEFTRAIEQALTSSVTEYYDISKYTWENYFRKILKELEE